MNPSQLGAFGTNQVLAGYTDGTTPYWMLGYNQQLGGPSPNQWYQVTGQPGAFNIIAQGPQWSPSNPQLPPGVSVQNLQRAPWNQSAAPPIGGATIQQQPSSYTQSGAVSNGGPATNSNGAQPLGGNMNGTPSWFGAFLQQQAVQAYNNTLFGVPQGYGAAAGSVQAAVTASTTAANLVAALTTWLQAQAAYNTSVSNAALITAATSGDPNAILLLALA